MNHCVGTSDSYVNKINRGEIEILSFRKTPTINKEENKLNSNDTPLITIEYNLKTKTIQQMKKYDDEYLMTNDPYYSDVLEALQTLRTTQTDTGEYRDFRSINSSELQNIPVADYHVFTNKGEISITDYNPNDPEVFVLKKGNYTLDNNTDKNLAEKIIEVELGKDISYEHIAFGVEDINEKTEMYIGPWNIDVYQKMPDTVKYLYESFPKTKIFKQSLELSTKTPEQYTKELTDKGNQIYTYAQQILNKIEPLKSPEQIKLVSFSVRQLGFPNGATLQEIYDKAQSMGLELCPPQVGPELRLSYTDQPNGEYLVIAMETITGADGDPGLFFVNRDDSGPWLDHNDGGLDFRWFGFDRFVFRSSKS
jgi:hypothetical protein